MIAEKRDSYGRMMLYGVGTVGTKSEIEVLTLVVRSDNMKIPTDRRAMNPALSLI